MKRVLLMALALAVAGVVFVHDSPAQQKAAQKLQKELRYAPRAAQSVLVVDSQRLFKSSLASAMTASEKKAFFGALSDQLGINVAEVDRVTVFGSEQGSLTVIHTQSALNGDQILGRKIAAEAKRYAKGTFNIVGGPPQIPANPNVKPKSPEEVLREKWQKTTVGKYRVFELTENSFGNVVQDAFSVVEPKLLLCYSMNGPKSAQPEFRHVLTAPQAQPLPPSLHAALKHSTLQQPIFFAYGVRDDDKLQPSEMQFAPAALKSAVQGIDWITVEANLTADDQVAGQLSFGCRDKVRPAELRKRLDAALAALLQEDTSASSDPLLPLMQRLYVRRLQKSLKWVEADQVLTVQFEVDPLHLLVPVTLLGRNANTTFNQVSNELGKTGGDKK